MHLKRPSDDAELLLLETIEGGRLKLGDPSGESVCLL